MLALPALDSLGRRSSAQAKAMPAAQRFLAYYVPNGIHMASWTPQQTGPGYDLPPILAPLVDAQAGIDLRDRVHVLTGLDNLPARPEGPGDHAAGTAGFLTCTHVNKSESDIRAAISCDQIMAQALGDQTQLASLQLGIEGGTNQGNCDSGYGCAYSRNISWADANTPLPKVTVPQLAFDLLFGGTDPDASAEEQARRKAYRLSVLDSVRDEARSLQSQLGQRDRDKLDEYLTGVRALERRINDGGNDSCDSTGFDGAHGNFAEHVDVMTDLMVLALSCDATRVITFMQGNAASGRSYGFIDVPGAHHDISHHGEDPANYAKLEKIGTWEVAQFARLLDKLDKVSEGDQTLLDNTLVFFSSEIEDGNRHAHHNLPVLLAGNADGRIDAGQHLRFEGQPLANLFTSIMQLMGVDNAKFGDDGTGPLAGFPMRAPEFRPRRHAHGTARR